MEVGLPRKDVYMPFIYRIASEEEADHIQQNIYYMIPIGNPFASEKEAIGHMWSCIHAHKFGIAHVVREITNNGKVESYQVYRYQYAPISEAIPPGTPLYTRDPISDRPLVERTGHVNDIIPLIRKHQHRVGYAVGRVSMLMSDARYELLQTTQSAR